MGKRIYIRDGRAPIPENETTSKVMSAIKGKDTKPELLLRQALFQFGIKGYRLHWKKVPGSPDIAFPKKKLAIFVNGCFWHRCPKCQTAMPKVHTDFWQNKFDKNIIRDSAKIKSLEELGWKVIVIWECDIKKNIIECIFSINNSINELN